MNYYTNQSYAMGRLEGTIVQSTDREPLFIESVKGDYYIVRDLLVSKSREVAPSLIDLTPVKLGWLNDGVNAYYVSRAPIRKWKQGLHPEHMAVDGELVGNGIGFKWVSANMHNTIMGIYPSYQSVLNNMEQSKALKRAFHRFWALDMDAIIWYKTMAVGNIVSKTPTLKSSFSYLKESFDRQVGVECAYS